MRWSICHSRAAMPASVLEPPEHDPTQYTTVINAMVCHGSSGKGTLTVHLLVRRSIQVTHLQLHQGSWITGIANINGLELSAKNLDAVHITVFIQTKHYNWEIASKLTNDTFYPPWTGSTRGLAAAHSFCSRWYLTGLDTTTGHDFSSLHHKVRRIYDRSVLLNVYSEIYLEHR